MAAKKSDPRRELAAKRRLNGWSQSKFADVIGASLNSVRAWEQGWTTPMPRYRRPIAEALGVSMAEVDRLLDGRPPELVGHEVPGWLSHYESLVHAAGGLIDVAQPIVPSLLQTKAYAAAIERCGLISLTDEQVVERVDVRLSRQSVLYRKHHPLNMVSLVTEHVLRSAVGGPEVMAEQLDHLVAMTGRPNVVLRVLPADGRDNSAQGGFELLTRPDEIQPFIAVTFDPTRPHYHETPHDIEVFVATYDYLLDAALQPDQSISRIEQIRERYR
jgi:transcriptional regulator with XRE-family HTH domain